MAIASLIFIIFWVIITAISVYTFLKSNDLKIPKISKRNLIRRKRKLFKEEKKLKVKAVNYHLRKLEKLVDKSIITGKPSNCIEMLYQEEDNLKIAAVLFYRKNRHFKVIIQNPTAFRHCTVTIDTLPDKPGLVKC